MILSILSILSGGYLVGLFGLGLRTEDLNSLIIMKVIPGMIGTGLIIAGLKIGGIL